MQGNVLYLHLFAPVGLHTHIGPLPSDLLDTGIRNTLHNAHIVQYLYLATELAWTYLKCDLMCHHLTYINPTLFSCEINIENSILVSFKL